jgi:hypothetical protein
VKHDVGRDEPHGNPQDPLGVLDGFERRLVPTSGTLGLPQLLRAEHRCPDRAHQVSASFGGTSLPPRTWSRNSRIGSCTYESIRKNFVTRLARSRSWGSSAS